MANTKTVNTELQALLEAAAAIGEDFDIEREFPTSKTLSKATREQSFNYVAPTHYTASTHTMVTPVSTPLNTNDVEEVYAPINNKRPMVKSHQQAHKKPRGKMQPISKALIRAVDHYDADDLDDDDINIIPPEKRICASQSNEGDNNELVFPGASTEEDVAEEIPVVVKPTKDAKAKGKGRAPKAQTKSSTKPSIITDDIDMKLLRYLSNISDRYMEIKSEQHLMRRTIESFSVTMRSIQDGQRDIKEDLKNLKFGLQRGASLRFNI